MFSYHETLSHFSKQQINKQNKKAFDLVSRYQILNQQVPAKRIKCIAIL